MGNTPYEEWKELHGLADLMDEGDPEEPVLIWNWEVNQEDGRGNAKYALSVMQGFVYHGGGPLHVGFAAKEYTGKSGTFDRLAAIYYPSRNFVSQFMRSQWFFEVVQDKDPGDGLMLVTVPYV